jgi:dihydroflavonol-4-reductase
LTEGNIMVRLFARWFKFRLATLPGRGTPVWNFAFIDDVVQGLQAAVNSSPDNDYILGGSNLSLADLVDSLDRVSSESLHRLGMPDWLFRISCYGEDLASRLMNFKPLVLPQTADFLLENWRFSSSKAQSELGYEPHGIEQALTLTYQWMKRTKII